MRTTSSVEAYNCQLNRRIVNNGGLFHFVHDLRGEEFMQREEMREFILSGTATAPKRRAEYVVSVFVCSPNVIFKQNMTYLFDFTEKLLFYWKITFKIKNYV